MKATTILTLVLIISILSLSDTYSQSSTDNVTNHQQFIEVKLLTGKVYNNFGQLQKNGTVIIYHNNRPGIIGSTPVTVEGSYKFQDLILPGSDGIKIMAYASDITENDNSVLSGGASLSLSPSSNGEYVYDVGSAEPGAIVSFSLDQNFPNPFNPATTISFVLPQASSVSLRVFDISGKEVATLISNETMSAGRNEVLFNAESLSSGVYFYSLQAGSYTDIKRMSLIK